MSPRRFSRISFPTLLLCLVVFSGCLPSACQRRESRSMFAADSLSRQIAEQTPIDTLTQSWETTGSIDNPFQYPRTVRFGNEGNLFVSDAKANQIFEYLNTGVLHRTHTSPVYSIPYLTGVRGDTLLVFNPETRRIDFTVNGRSVSHTALETPLPSEQALQYTSANDANIFYKVLGENFDNYIVTLDDNAVTSQKIDLPGPFWRHSGLLRHWGDSLLSLSAYRPVVDIITADGQLDSLVLSGFDSPMLPRSKAYMEGDIDEPPLLSPSAAAVNNTLFVLNLRPGWLRIDAFNREGRLIHRLVQRDPGFSKDYYPIDIDVRLNEEEEYELAIVFVEPEPRLVVYRWKPAS